MPVKDINLVLIDTEGGEFDLLNTHELNVNVDLIDIPSGVEIGSAIDSIF